MATYGHNQNDVKYGHHGYPRKEYEKCSSPVKESSDLGVWFKSYSQNKNFELFPYVNYVKLNYLNYVKLKIDCDVRITMIKL